MGKDALQKGIVSLEFLDIRGVHEVSLIKLTVFPGACRIFCSRTVLRRHFMSKGLGRVWQEKSRPWVQEAIPGFSIGAGVDSGNGSREGATQYFSKAFMFSTMV